MTEADLFIKGAILVYGRRSRGAIQILWTVPEIPPAGLLIGCHGRLLDFLVGLFEMDLGLLRVASHIVFVGFLSGDNLFIRVPAEVLRGGQVRMAAGVDALMGCSAE